MQAETGDPIWKTYTEYNIRFMECWNPVSSVHHFKMSASYDSYMLVWYERSFVTVSSLYVNNSQLGSMQKNTNNNRLSFFSLSVYFFFTFLMITEDIDACNLVYSHTKFLFLLFFHFSLSTFIAFIERRCLFRFLSNKSPLIAQHFSLNWMKVVNDWILVSVSSQKYSIPRINESTCSMQHQRLHYCVKTLACNLTSQYVVSSVYCLTSFQSFWHSWRVQAQEILTDWYTTEERKRRRKV